MAVMPLPPLPVVLGVSGQLWWRVGGDRTAPIAPRTAPERQKRRKKG